MNSGKILLIHSSQFKLWAAASDGGIPSLFMS